MCFFKRRRAKREAAKLAEIEAEREALKQKQAKNAKKQEKVVKEVKPKPVEEKPSTVDKPPKYHVSQNKSKNSPYFKNWGVRRERSKKTIKYFDTQLEAIDYAQHLADQAGSSIVIHKVDGQIRKQDYSK